jgi:gamma-glutamyl:cysteine ligase YbdK (ATP-grasp superfamily)
MTGARRLHLFERVGVEIEYMIVDRRTLNVMPVADELFRDVLGEYGSDVEAGPVTWSNELVAHVVELKTSSPAPSVASGTESFLTEIRRINSLLEAREAILLPTAMHPWMDPRTETKLWPHEGHEVYDNFDRVFGCQGHGWSNLQSMHLNLPFAGDDEFARLHSAIRLVLPLIPALAASSPFEEGRCTGWMDNRLKHYRTNSQRIPAVAGQIIPEPVRSEEEYHDTIFRPMFDAIAPFDPAGEMQDEWLNARGAIPRFGRGSIEIRVIDSQESVDADTLIGSAIVAVVRSLVDEKWSSFRDQFAVKQSSLTSLFESACERADEAVTREVDHLRSLGIHQQSVSAADIWRSLAAQLPDEIGEPLARHIDRRPLARRLIQAVGSQVNPDQLAATYRRLSDHLADNTFFDPNA